jgi:ribosomal protein S12 methylthiotransferase
LQAKIGRTLDVIVDGFDERGAVARSHADAPEIDGNVLVSGAEKVRVGDIVKARVDSADAYDLYATLVPAKRRAH